MSLFWRARTAPRAPEGEQRSGWPISQLLGMMRQTYEHVDLSSADSALQSVAVRAAVDLIASVASELPLDVYRGRGPQRAEVRMPSWLEDPDGSGQGLEDWCYRVLVSWLLRGNLYGNVLDRGSGGMLRQVDIWHPDSVHPQVDNGVTRWFVSGQEVPQQQMLHRRVNPVPGQELGLSPVSYHAWTIGLSLTATRFGLQWFQDGAHPSGILRNAETAIDEATANTAKQRFLAALRGTRDPVVLGKGWEWTQLQLNPEESQFLETQRYSAAECARIFGPGIAEVLGYADGKSMTYANIQDRDLHVLKYALNRWLRRLERLLSEFLPRPVYAQFNRDALLQTNTLTRYQAHASALTQRWRTVNEVREIEDLPPVEWGDEPNALPGAAEPEPEPNSEPGNGDEGDED